MKKLIQVFCLALCIGAVTSAAKAQNKLGKTEDLGRIVVNSHVSRQIEGLPASAERMLINKMNQIASANGLGGSALNPRFIITPNITVLTKDITPTAPPMHAFTLEVTLYIGDGIEGTKFSSTSMEVKGVGTNETKAYIAGLKQIKTNDPTIQAFVEEGKTKIVEYYNSRCDFILKEAQALEAQQKYDAAIFKLTAVPEVCKECFDKCMDAVAPIYQKQIDRDCEVLLADATNIWNTRQDLDAANKAIQPLGKIDPNAACFDKANAFSKTIAKRVKELDKRDWDFKLKEQKQESERIQAIRDIGVAFGNGQPKTVSYNVSGWWR